LIHLISPRIGDRRYPDSLEEGGKNYRGRPQGASKTACSRDFSFLPVPPRSRPLNLLIVVAGEQSWSRRRETALARVEGRLRARQGDRTHLENGRRQGEAGRRDRLKGHRESRLRCAKFLYFPLSYLTVLIKAAGATNVPPQRKASTASVTPSTAGASNNNGARTAKSDGVSTSITGDKTRDKCIEMLYDALALESGFRASSTSPSPVPIKLTSLRLQRLTSYCNVLARSRIPCPRTAKGPRRRTNQRYECCS
jgi:hypothetical protein